MIDQCFVCCRGIGGVTQKKLNDAGFHSWKSILDVEVENKKPKLPISRKLWSSVQQELVECQEALDTKDLKFLIDRLPTKDHWRILSTYLSEASYFDIETTGLSSHDSVITVISCLHKGQLHTFVRGENMDDFLDLLEDISLLVSFNGNSFDAPRVVDGFHIPELPCAHIDLRWILFHCGFKGGLKSIEEEMGFGRESDLKGLSGDDAVWLWQKWKLGCVKSRELLIRYCEEDVVSLQKISSELLKTPDLLQ